MTVPGKNDREKSDHSRGAKGLQFGCGAVVGALMGLFGVAAFIADTSLGITLVTFAFSIGCGLLAIRYGNRFWENLPFFWP